MDKHDHLLKIIIVGDQEVGKSNILLQLTDKTFRDDYAATIGVEFGCQFFQINDKTVKLQIWDLAGVRAFLSITRSYYEGSNGVLLVFDITNRESFNNVQSWYNEVKEKVTGDCQFLLVGNKTDLEAERKISTIEAQKFAEKYQMLYEEVSAKAGQNIVEPFRNLAMKILPRIKIQPKVEKEQDEFQQYISNLSEAEKAALFEGIKLKFKQQ